MHIYVRVLKELKRKETHKKNHTFTLPSAGQTQNTRNTYVQKVCLVEYKTTIGRRMCVSANSKYTKRAIN